MNTIPAIHSNESTVPGTSQTPGAGSQSLKKTLDLCIQKTRNNIEALANEPKTWSWDVDGNYANWNEDLYAIGNWTSSFITGMALLAWRETEEDHFLNQVLRLQHMYQDKVFVHHADTMHDLGFLYSLYSVALFKLTGKSLHRETALRAAELLASRYNPRGKFIRAWGRLDCDTVATIDDGSIPVADMAIIDSMMNLPLLFWAAEETGNVGFREIALNHADTTLKNFIREDHSVYHAFRFNLETGAPVRGENYCGRDVESYWARGAAWAIYGLAICHRYTRIAKYHEAALCLARKFISNLDSKIIPVWDFRLPGGEARLRDSSAAAIAVCGFQELLKQAKHSFVAQAKERLLNCLCSEDYVNFNLNCPGILRLGQVGRAQNTYTSWGDYFLMEALVVEQHGNGTFW